MLDIKFIRENPDLVREAVRKKYIKFDLSRLLNLDGQRKTLLQEVERMRSEHNKRSDEVAKVANEYEKQERIEKLKELKHQLQHKGYELKVVEGEFKELMFQVPNIPDPSVPEGETEADSKEIRRWPAPSEVEGGEKPSFGSSPRDFEPKDHIQIMQDLNLVDFDKGVKVAGFRGFFLKNEAVRLSFAIWQLAADHLSKKGFEMLMAPMLVREHNFIGTGWLPQGKEEIYHTQDELHLVGTSEVSVMGLHKDEILTMEDLPVKYVAFSPCFRREIGSYGKDTKGLFRVHEFYKIEQVILCEASHKTSVRLHEDITRNAEEVVRMLEIPYRVVINAGGDLGLGQVKKYDIEVWIPSQRRFRESHSSSYFHDFQTRRLNIRYRTDDGTLKFCHSLNNTAIATPRILISLIENHQQSDGSIAIPKALHPYMGQEIIRQK